MNAVTRFVHVVFGSYPRNRDGLSAPGDADCRWRVAAALEPVDPVEDARHAHGEKKARAREGAGREIA